METTEDLIEDYWKRRLRAAILDDPSRCPYCGDKTLERLRFPVELKYIMVEEMPIEIQPFHDPRKLREQPCIIGCSKCASKCMEVAKNYYRKQERIAQNEQRKQENSGI